MPRHLIAGAGTMGGAAPSLDLEWREGPLIVPDRASVLRRARVCCIGLCVICRPVCAMQASVCYMFGEIALDIGRGGRGT